MSRKEKLLHRLLSAPKDFTFDELVTLLGYLDYEEVSRGKTGGSRRAFINLKSKHIIRIHKPHPANVLKGYQIKDIIEELVNRGVI